MINDNDSHVIYYVLIVNPKHRAKARLANNNQDEATNLPEIQETLNHQKQSVIDFIGNNSYLDFKNFTEIMDSRRSNKWPELEKALALCKENNCNLIIPEIGVLTHNENFSKILIASGVKFHCCDQPYINADFLKIFMQHVKIQRKHHGELIKKGLKYTSARSGNPNAQDVIRQVNEPKIHTAILFAQLISPIVDIYTTKFNYSQRSIVRVLNNEGFTAPEGGTWVLSQLQKVLERVKLNKISAQAYSSVKEIINNKDISNEQLTVYLNENNIPALKRGDWTFEQTTKLIERIKQLNNIDAKNDFILNLLKIIKQLKQENLSVTEILKILQSQGLKLHNQQNVTKATEELN